MTTTDSTTTPARAPGTVPALVGTSFNRRGWPTRWRVMPDGDGYVLQWESSTINGQTWEFWTGHASRREDGTVKIYRTLAAARRALLRQCPNSRIS